MSGKAKGRKAVKLAGIEGRCMYVKLDLVLELKDQTTGINEAWNNANVWKVFARALADAYPKLGVVGYVGLEREIDVLHPALAPKATARRVAAPKRSDGT